MTPAKTYNMTDGLKWMIDNRGVLLFDEESYPHWWSGFKFETENPSGLRKVNELRGSKPTPAEPKNPNRAKFVYEFKYKLDREYYQDAGALIYSTIEDLVESKVNELRRELTGDGRK
jgi:hypothetical protein